MQRTQQRLGGLLALCFASGCGGLSSYAVPTTGVKRAPTTGPMAIFASRPPPEGSEVGIIEARGSRAEAGVEVLFPELVRRAQELGANAVVIDWMGARFEILTTYVSQTTLFPCGTTTCSRVDTLPQTHEEMTVVLRGRAFLVPLAAEASR